MKNIHYFLICLVCSMIFSGCSVFQKKPEYRWSEDGWEKRGK